MYSYVCLFINLFIYFDIYVCVYANLRYRGRNSLKKFSYMHFFFCEHRLNSWLFIFGGKKKRGQKKRQTTGMLITLS